MTFEFSVLYLTFLLLGIVLTWKPNRRWLWTLGLTWLVSLVAVTGQIGNFVGFGWSSLLVVLVGLFFWGGRLQLFLAGVILFFLTVGLVVGGQLHRSLLPLDFTVSYFNGLILEDRLALDLKFLIFALLAGVFVCVVQGVTQHTYEQLVISLLAVIAGVLTFTTDNLILLYLNLELQALALYTLVGYYRFEDESTDAALRYLMSGSLISGFILLSFINLYSQNGSFLVGEFHGIPPGGIWLLGAFFFKLGIAPFHFWTPTVYTPLGWPTLLLVVAPAKVNLWFLWVQVFSPLTTNVDFQTTLVVSGWLSVLVGALGGLFQTSAGSLLAYSGVLNGGYLLLLAVGQNLFSFTYYLAIYLVGTAAVIITLSTFFEPQTIYYRFWSRFGLVAPLGLYYFVLNAAGLPVFPGFFGKFYLLEGVLISFGFLAAFLVVLFSIIPAVYYVFLAVSALFEPTQTETRFVRFGTWSPTGIAAGLALGLSLVEFLFFVM